MQLIKNAYTIPFLKGMFVGIANAVPGISGGTIAVICNVYDMLLLIASFNIKKIKKVRKETASLGIGIATGVIGFSKLITRLYALYPIQINYFFIGVIIGSLSFLYDTVRKAIILEKTGCAVKKSCIKALLCGTAGLFIMLSLYYLEQHGIRAAAMELNHSFSAMITLCCLGALAAFAMLIPGLSGSFILLIFGAYQAIIQAVAALDILLLLPVGLGVAGGLLSGSRLIHFLLEKYPAPVYSTILGLALGSILFLLPHTCQPFFMRLISAALLLAGYSITAFFSRKGQIL